ncbi:MAG: hypothetical protein ACI376_02040 [Candidatus Bruticola sp.]
MKRICCPLGVIALTYVIILLVLTLPIWQAGDNVVLGAVTDDTFDEMVLNRSVLDSLKEGNFPLTSQAWEFPLNINLVITHKSYLHTLIGCFWQMLCSWPAWWNMSLLSAIWLSALGSSWAVLYLGTTDSQLTDYRRRPYVWLLSWLSGLPFLMSPYTVQMINWGHLPQLFSLPVSLSLVAAASIFTVHNSKDLSETRPAPLSAYVLLSISVIAAAGVYWIWAAGLTLAGLALTFVRGPYLDKISLKRLTVCVCFTGLAACPAAFYVLHVDPDLQRYQNTAQLNINAEENRAFERMSHLTFTPQQEGKSLTIKHGSSLISPILILMLFSIPLSRKFQQNSALIWLWLASFFILIGLGPYLNWNGVLLLDTQGRPIQAPLAWLAKLTNLIFYWRTPQTVWPLAINCLIISLTLFICRTWQNWKDSSLNKRCWQNLVAIGLTLLTVLLSISCRENELFSTSQQIKQSYYPAFKVSVPDWCVFLAAQTPKYASLDLPLGYCTNVWQTQFLHGSPSAHGKRSLSWLARNNSYIAQFLLLNKTCSSGFITKPYPNEGSSEVLYGQEKLPQQFMGDTSPSRFSKTSDSSTNQDLKAGTVNKYIVKKDAELVFKDGLRYLIVHRANCAWLAPQHGKEVYDNFNKQLSKIYGSPVYRDSQASIYLIDKSVLGETLN